jgi:Domain of unknown function (DUF4442)
MESGTAEFIRFSKHPFKFRLFLLSKLPSAFFSGLQVAEIDEGKCEVTVPYRWFTRNPFRSTYFACLSMAAEMSTGALSMAHVHKREPTISMLVVKTEAFFYKKATNRAKFVCDEGLKTKETIDHAVQSGEGQTVTVKTTGRSESGERIAEFFITWSFKTRMKRESNTEKKSGYLSTSNKTIT